MPKQRLTDSFLRAVKVDRQTDYTDEVAHGLIARVNPGGSITFSVRYQAKRSGVEKARFKIGRYPTVSLAQARAAARSALSGAALGEDPARRRRAPAEGSFSQVAERWLEEWAKPRKRTWKQDKRSIDTNLVPAWGRLPPGEITAQDVRSLLRKIRDRGAPVQANRTQSLIHTIFRWAVEEGIVRNNPAAGLRRLTQETAEGKALTDDELVRVWNACVAEGSIACRALQVLILTGARSSEVTGGSYSEIVEPPHWWEVPGERMKAKRPHTIYLVDTALEIIATLDPLRAYQQCDFFFPGRGGEVLETGSLEIPTPIRWLPRAYVRVQQLAGAIVTPRTIRRTFATGLAALSVPERVQDECLSHVPQSVRGRHYDRWSYREEKREAWCAWERHLRGLLLSAAAAHDERRPG